MAAAVLPPVFSKPVFELATWPQVTSLFPAAIRSWAVWIEQRTAEEATPRREEELRTAEISLWPASSRESESFFRERHSDVTERLFGRPIGVEQDFQEENTFLERLQCRIRMNLCG